MLLGWNPLVVSETLHEVAKCKRSGILINTFMLDIGLWAGAVRAEGDGRCAEAKRISLRRTRLASTS